MKRKLGKFETASAITGENFAWNIVAVIIIEGKLSPQDLRSALDIAQKRHPMLNVRIVRQKKGYEFQDGEIPQIPLKIIQRENDSQWVSVVENELNEPVDQLHGPLMRCIYLDGQENGSEIVLSVHHAIADGIVMERFSHELVELCEKSPSSIAISSEFSPNPPLPPVEALFPREYRGVKLHTKSIAYLTRQMTAELKYQWDIQGTRKPRISLRTRVHIIRSSTPAEITSRLVARARKERITLNSILNAALIISIQKLKYGGAQIPYRYMSFADLRPYLEPPPPANQFASYVSMLRFTIKPLPRENLWSLANRVNQQIYRATKMGEKFITAYMSEQFMRLTFGLKKIRMCATAISYTGSTGLLPPKNHPIQIKSIQGFVSNIGLGPEFSGVVSFQNNTLCWNMLYMDVDMDREMAERMMDSIQEVIKNAVLVE